jgi:hypothetical protein
LQLFFATFFLLKTFFYKIKQFSRLKSAIKKIQQHKMTAIELKEGLTELTARLHTQKCSVIALRFGKFSVDIELDCLQKEKSLGAIEGGVV